MKLQGSYELVRFGAGAFFTSGSGFGVTLSLPLSNEYLTVA